MASPPGNVPAALTPLIGRGSDLVAVSALFEQARLLTLIGPGGVGKTRLALAASAQHGARFTDGVFFVDLAPLRDAAHISAAIAAALGLRELSGPPLSAVLTSFLRERSLLLVLDNFEHLLAGASVVETLLTACPGLCVLATSRAALQLQGEHLYAVAPLALPEVETEPFETVAHYAAVVLFVDRANAVQPEFALTEGNAAQIAAICRRLDGLPLALELAAVRLNVLSPGGLLARLDQRLPLLTGGLRSAPERQQTLRATLAWSYDLLSPKEQTLFHRLAVFVGGWTLEAAEQVCELEPQGSVLDTLARLVDNSLVQTRVGPTDEPRFTMLETVREFALERLATSGEAASLRDRHALTFLALAEAASPNVSSFRVRDTWQARLEREHDNLRAALAWCLAAGDRDDQALRLAAALASFWHTRGYLSEGRRWLAQALAAGSTVPIASRAWALTEAAVLAEFQGDSAAARSQAEAALVLWRELADAPGIAFTLAQLGFGATMRGKLAAGRALVDEGVGCWRTLGGGPGLTLALNTLALVTRLQGDLPASVAAAEEELDLARAQQDPLWMAMATRHLGRLALEQHDAPWAERLLDQSLRLFRQQADPWQIAASLLDLMQLALTAGDAARAMVGGEEALSLFEQVGMNTGVAATQHALGHAARLADDVQRAARHYAASMVPQRPAGTEYLGALGLAGLGWAALRLGRFEQAAQLLASAQTLRARPGPLLDQVSRSFYERDLGTAAIALGSEAFAVAWAEGEALTPEQANAAALALAAEIAALPSTEIPRGQLTPETKRTRRTTSPQGLTAREQEILRLVANGRSNREIAAALVLSVRTIERHLDNLFAKTGLHGRQQLRTYAETNDLVRPA